MENLLDVKLEHIQKDFLVNELEQHCWNLDAVSSRYAISKQELLNALGNRVIAGKLSTQFRKAGTTI